MLFDPAKMRRENHVARFKSLFNDRGDRIKYPDQDILNLAYADDCMKLPLRWNLNTTVYRNPPVESIYTLEETLDALTDPGICHFTGRHKPWIFGATTHHPYASFYPYFAAMAGWAPGDLLKLKLKFHWFTGILKKPKEKVPWGPGILKKSPATACCAE
jgi:lipopolysaccharide biosynthesis glycosyltransferase